MPWSVPLTFEPDSNGWMLVEEATATTAGFEDRFGNLRQMRMHRRIYTGPFFGMAAADRLLPRTEEEEGGPATVFRSESTWLEVTRDGNDDLSDGSGVRFAVDDPPAATEICLETDQLGIFQAFAVRL